MSEGMMDDLDMSFPAQVVVTPEILGQACESLVKEMDQDPARTQRLGMGLVMFVHILKLQERERKG